MAREVWEGWAPLVSAVLWRRREREEEEEDVWEDVEGDDGL